MNKLERLKEVEGLTDIEIAQNAALGGESMGICMNEGCNYTREVEPDQDHGYCEECKTTSVQSGAMLLGII